MAAGLACSPPPASEPASPAIDAPPRPQAPVAPAPGFAHSLLLITVDTLRADALGFAGNPRAETSTLDRMAASGWVFEHAHAHNVMTLPSHANILTGRLPFEHGIRDNGGFVLPESLPTAATLLADAGFATAAVVGAFPLDARYRLDRGFELYDDRYPEGSGGDFVVPERRGDEVVTLGERWWNENGGKRRFLWLHLYDPHAPYEPPPPFASRFAADPYLGEVAAVDAFLAPLLDPLLDRASDSQTDPQDGVLVVFTADHGEALGDHGEHTHGLFTYEATLRVPLVLWSPALSPERIPLSVSHVDLLPTLLEAAGVAAPSDLPGRSLLSAAGSEQPVYFEALRANLNRGWAPLRGVIDAPYKYIELPLAELYHLGEDPEERLNRLDRERERAARLAGLLPLESAWPPPRSAVSEQEMRALRSLGYLTGGSGSVRRDYNARDDPKQLLDLDRRLHRFIDAYRSGRLEEAEQLARKVVAERPQMSVGHEHLAKVLLEQGETGEALAVMRDAYRTGVAAEALVRQLALTLAEVGEARTAVGLLEPFADGADPETLITLGVVLSEAGDQAAAERTVERVFSLDEDNPRAHEILALTALRRSDWAACERQARRALELNDRLPLAWNYLGVALYNLGRRQQALAAWRTSLELDAADYDVLYNLAIVAAESGAVEEARRALERFVESAPAARYAPDIAAARERLARLPRQ